MTTKSLSLHSAALRVALSLLIASLLLFGVKLALTGGVLLALALGLAAYGVRSDERWRGIAFSLLIFSAVVLAMCFPAPLVSIGDFSLNRLITPLLQLIMFGMGTRLSAGDFINIVRAPKAVGVGLLCQFSIMPFLALVLTLVFRLDAEIAAGVILIGSAPSGLASNVMAYIARANVALSVTLTTCATLLAPLVTPFYMQWLAGQYIPIDTLGMMWNIVQITILPIVAGLVFNHFLRGRTAWLDRLMPQFSMLGIVLILMIMTAGGRDNLLDIGLLLIGVSLLHNLGGYLLGYWSCRALRFDERTCRTIAFEVGLQNAGLGTSLAQGMGKLATVGLAPTVFGSIMNITGATLATLWRERPLPEETLSATSASELPGAASTEHKHA
jgi:BASS family bile acid:Na+ symporter